MLVALSAQRYPLPFQNFLHTRQARSDHRVVQRFADHARQVQPQLSPRGFPSILALGTLVHGGLLLLPNPIFRSGEECRHSNLNNLQDIAQENPKGAKRISKTVKKWFAVEARVHGWAGGNFLPEVQSGHGAGCVLFVPPQKVNVNVVVTNTTLVLKAETGEED